MKGLAHARVRLEIDGLAGSFELIGDGFERASARVESLDVIIEWKEPLRLRGGDARTTEDAGDDGREESVASMESRRRATRLDRAPGERHCEDETREAAVYLDRAAAEWNRASLCAESV